MGSSMKLFTLTFVLLALIELGFGLICSNPEAYKNTFVADPKGKQKGECVSFYKVNIFFYLSAFCLFFLFRLLKTH
jgi:hypothetical protein